MTLRELMSWLRGLLGTELFQLGDQAVTVGSVFAALVIVAASFVIAWMLEKAVVRTLRQRVSVDEGNVGVAGRLLYYVCLVLGLAVALHAAGLNLSALFAAGAVFAVGIGFGLQNIVQNFVAGITLLVERIIKPGDVLEIDGELVKVRQIGLRATVARTLDDEDVIVPNGVLMQSNVRNFTFRDRLVRLRLPVGVTYDSDLPRVFEVLEAAATDMKGRSRARPPRVLLSGFGSSSIDFEVSVWLEDPWQLRTKRSDLAMSVWRALKDAGIVIAFPQLDLHLDRAGLEALEGRSRFEREVVDERSAPSGEARGDGEPV